MNNILYILLGLIAGIFGGMFGLGGGVIVIPALVYLFGLSQLQAQGTNLIVMLPPIGLLAALRYYQNGQARLGIAGFIALGFFLGAFAGAHIVQVFPEVLMRRLFGAVLFFVSLKKLLGR